MKKTSITLLLFIYCFGIMAYEMVIEKPAFSAWNSTTIEIDKVVASDTATILYLTSYYLPHNWVRISSDTYIRANGEKLLVRSSENFELDKEIYMDETGRRSFSLTFPPVDPETTHIDFIESDCEDCFKIWGIELKAGVLTNKQSIPDEVLREAMDYTSANKLKEPVIGFGNAAISGKIYGYVPEIKSSVNVRVVNPVTYEWENHEFPVNSDGTFDIRVPLFTATSAGLSFQGISGCTMVIEPFTESKVFIDLPQRCCEQSRNRRDNCQNKKWIYFTGHQASLNNLLADKGVVETATEKLNYHVISEEISNMTADAYKAYVLNKMKDTLDELIQKELTPEAVEYGTILAQIVAANLLVDGDFYLEQAYRNKYNISYNQPLTGFVRPVFNREYFDELKNFPLNSPLSFYSNDYTRLLHNCIMLAEKVENHPFSPVYLSVEQLQKLLDNKNQDAEITNYIHYLQTKDYRKWNNKEITATKKKISTQMKTLADTGKLTEEEIIEVNKVIEVCNDKYTRMAEVMKSCYLLATYIFNNANNKLSDADKKEIGQAATLLYTNPEFPDEIMENFNEQYNKEINFFRNENLLKESKEILATIFNTDKGILFDLMETQTYMSKLQDYTLPDDWEIAKIQMLENKKFYDYLLTRSDEINRIFEENKNKSNYRVYTVNPETEPEKIFEEIISPFKEKVILVDFWATWCGPCKIANKNFKETKESFLDKEVKFLYLTDESSPLKAWEYMIADIPGEHFRLTNKQFRYLRNKFGAEGVPSYLILDKKGQNVYFRVGFAGSSAIANVLEEQLKKN